MPLEAAWKLPETAWKGSGQNARSLWRTSRPSRGFRQLLRDWISAARFLIPAGIVEISPGSRSESDENPGILDLSGIRPRAKICNPCRDIVIIEDFTQSLRTLVLGQRFFDGEGFHAEQIAQASA